MGGGVGFFLFLFSSSLALSLSLYRFLLLCMAWRSAAIQSDPIRRKGRCLADLVAVREKRNMLLICTQFVWVLESCFTYIKKELGNRKEFQSLLANR